ncbi:MAG: lamin tail domain-containing protein [Bacteroidota bacterium]
MQRFLLITMILLGGSLALFAQVNDDFSDGDFTTNPTWVGETALWQVTAQELQSNGVSGQDNIHLSTASTRVAETEWRIKIRFDESPSTNNRIRFYLVSDQSDLEGPLNGYFVEMGENGNNDTYGLYRQDGTDTTELIRGPDGLISTGIDAVVKVLRDAGGNWSLSVEEMNAGFFVDMGTAFDATYSNGQFAGIWVRHSSTRRDRFFFDDVFIGEIIQDTIPPALLVGQLIDPQNIVLDFSEPLDSASVANLSNYVLNPGAINPASASLDGGDPRRLSLSFSNPFQGGTSYTLEVQNLEDLAGNTQAGPDSFTFDFFIPAVGGFKDVIINEIMPDPNPVVLNLPDIEYLEIYNRSDSALDLGGWTISNGTTEGLLPEASIRPGEYILLVPPGTSNQFANFGTVISPSSWTSLVNSGDNLGLRSSTGILIDTVDYLPAWFQDDEREGGGYSLELINPDNIDCPDISNWRATSSNIGGTPGQENSIFSVDSDVVPPQILSAGVQGTNTVVLCFNEPMDEASIGITTQYNLDNGLGNPTQANPQGPDFLCVELVFSASLVIGTPYVLSVNNVQDCSGNTLTVDSISLARGRAPQPFEIVITELFPDPESGQPLPNAEFVEILNRTSDILDLSQLSLADASSSASLGEQIIFPGEYLILCSSFDTASYSPFGRAIPLNSFPSLNNTQDSIRLVSQFGDAIDYVFYDDSWYRNANRTGNGTTLERIDPDFVDCNNPLNWRASNASDKGTPGAENSVKAVFVDTDPPQISGVEVISSNEVILKFNESMDAASLMEEFNFSINLSIGIPFRAIPLAADNASVLLSFTESLQPSFLYRLTFARLLDCSGNELAGTAALGIPVEPDENDVIFSEIFTDFTPPVGLPEAEYIEIFNRTQKIIAFNSLVYQNGNTEVNLGDGFMLPRQYVILCAEEDVAKFEAFGTVRGLSTFPTLGNVTDSLYLRATNTNVQDFVFYSNEWYGNADFAEGGYSLERIDQNIVACNIPENWQASFDVKGGTPGKENTVRGNLGTIATGELMAVRVLSPTMISLKFDRQMDEASLIDVTRYELNNGIGNPLAATVVDAAISEVLLLLPSAIEENRIYQVFTFGVFDCSGNEVTVEAEFGLPQPVAMGDILINEILFNPVSGGSDYVEIINASQKVIDLDDLMLGEVDPETREIFNADPVSTRSNIILPGEILCLTGDEAFQRLQYLPPLEAKFLEMEGFPSYDDSKGEAVIFTKNDSTAVDQFFYEDDYHYPTLFDDDGVALERISTESPTQDPESWQSASSVVGYGTPGYENSQFIPENPEEEEVFLDPPTFSPNLDGRDDNMAIRYNLSFPGANIIVTIHDTYGRKIRTLQQNTLLGTGEGLLIWDGFEEDGSKADVGMYIVLFEVFDQDTGTRRRYRRVAVLADEF